MNPLLNDYYAGYRIQHKMASHDLGFNTAYITACWLLSELIMNNLKDFYGARFLAMDKPEVIYIKCIVVCINPSALCYRFHEAML